MLPAPSARQVISPNPSDSSAFGREIVPPAVEIKLPPSKFVNPFATKLVLLPATEIVAPF